MEAFLWTLLVLHVLACWGCIRWLLMGKFPARTAKVTALDAVMHAVLFMWALSLIVKG